MGKHPIQSEEDRILIVEDNDDSRWLLTRACHSAGYTVSQAALGREALNMLKDEPFDVMLLDLHLPDTDGVEVLDRARSLQPDLITIILTANPTLDSAIAAVKAGVVDYLRKPAANKEVLETIEVNLTARRERRRRRSQSRAEERFFDGESPQSESTAGQSEAGDEQSKRHELRFDRATRQVEIVNDENRTVTLTKGEAAILAALLDHVGAVQSSEDLVREAWGEELEPWHASSIVRPLIFRLRQKLEEEPSLPRFIRTVRGSGYVFEPD